MAVIFHFCAVLDCLYRANHNNGQWGHYQSSKIPGCKCIHVYMLFTKFGFGPSENFTAQSMDQHCAQQSENSISDGLTSRHVAMCAAGRRYGYWDQSCMEELTAQAGWLLPIITKNVLGMRLHNYSTVQMQGITNALRIKPHVFACSGERVTLKWTHSHEVSERLLTRASERVWGRVNAFAQRIGACTYYAAMYTIICAHRIIDELWT